MQAFDLMKDYMSGVIEHSGKMVVLMEIIEQCIMLQEKILIFRYFVTLTCSEQNDTEFEVTIEQQMLTLCDLRLERHCNVTRDTSVTTCDTSVS